MSIAEGIGIVLIGVGVLLMLIVSFGMFRLNFPINRMHITSVADSAATLLILAGAALCRGFEWVNLKLILILILQWVTAPVCGHLIAQMEYHVVDDLKDHCVDDEKEEV